MPKCLNAFFDLWTGGKKRPVFYSIDQECPELHALTQNAAVIREEVLSLVNSGVSLPSYHDLDKNQTRIATQGPKGAQWRVFLLYAMGIKPEWHRAKLPKTSALLDQIPNLYQAFVSVLDPMKPVGAHDGPFRGYLRYHLGLECPTENPPSIRVKDQIYTWKQGEGVLFDDSWNHEVYNQCPKRRIVIIVDILRPMPTIPRLVNKVLMFLVRISYARTLIRKAKPI